MACATKFGDESREPTEAEWSKFEKRLGISDSSHLQLSDSSSGTREFDKICALITCFSNGDRYDIRCDCCVYSIDVNSSSTSNFTTLQSLEPIIYWNMSELVHRAFAILGSKLYMFGGLVRLDGHFDWGADMSYYDMERALFSSTKTTRLDKESLVKGPKMSGRKVDPVAVVIGDSKICVFGTVLYVRGKTFSRPSFELLDTSSDLSWKPLPEPMTYKKLHYESVCIQSYCVHRSCLIIKIPELGIYGINVNNPEPKWVTLDRSENKGFPFDGMFTMVDKMLCGPFNVTRRGDLHSYPIALEAPTIRESLVTGYPPKGALCFDDRCNNLCIARAAFPFPDFGPVDIPTDLIPNLLVDIVKLDDEALEKLGSDLSKWQEIQSNKSFTFALTSCLGDSMDIIACFPIKNAYRNNERVAEVDQGKMKKTRKRKCRKQ